MVNNEDKKTPNILSKIDKYLYDLVVSALEGNQTKSEMAALHISRLISKENPSLSKKIQEILGTYSLRGSSAMRSAGVPPIPVDMDTRLEMATVVSPSLAADIKPILSPIIQERVDSFLEERQRVLTLLEHNVRPSNSLLLIGQPGTGKTMLAHYIASSLNKNLIILDLSASISSLLGKTGHNIKKVLQYAKQTGSVLLLDEFDAIAKKRDDNTDLGEIKRVVNILLMELEDWPTSSVLIATSNHPELLDKAIWRRFDHTIEILVPETTQREMLLNKGIGEFFNDNDDSKAIIPIIAEILENKSAADICKFANNVKRRIIIKNEPPLVSCLHELELFTTDKKVIGKICLLARDKLKLTVRDIAKLTGLSIGGVQHHLDKIKKK